MSVQYARCMSIRRTQQTVERLWKFSMEGQEGRAVHGTNGHYANNHIRQSPDPCDPEAGYKEHPPPPELSAMQMQPPRLQGAGICSKFFTMTMCCLCLGITFVVWSSILSMPTVVEARGRLTKRLSGGFEESAPARPIPAILRRFALIRRARAPTKGADPDSIQAAFPSWRWPDGLPEGTHAVVSDLSLAISALVERLDPPPVETRQLELPRPIAKTATAPEPAPPNSLLEEDMEL